ncbi:MAG: hypothetical protein NVV83_22000 [Afipia sp.]|nr:hypothetical protein [Afipia sp.]
MRGNQRKSLRANSQSVACITFTNVAKDEISERTEHDSLFQVSTIHDFLWGCIKPFQSELKAAVATLNLGLSAKESKAQGPGRTPSCFKEFSHSVVLRSWKQFLGRPDIS